MHVYDIIWFIQFWFSKNKSYWPQLIKFFFFLRMRIELKIFLNRSQHFFLIFFLFSKHFSSSQFSIQNLTKWIPYMIFTTTRQNVHIWCQWSCLAYFRNVHETLTIVVGFAYLDAFGSVKSKIWCLFIIFRHHEFNWSFLNKVNHYLGSRDPWTQVICGRIAWYEKYNIKLK